MCVCGKFLSVCLCVTRTPDVRSLSRKEVLQTVLLPPGLGIELYSNKYIFYKNFCSVLKRFIPTIQIEINMYEVEYFNLELI